MKANTSFSQKLRDGWTKERLMAHYALTEVQYEKVLGCLKATGAQMKVMEAVLLADYILLLGLHLNQRSLQGEVV